MDAIEMIGLELVGAGKPFGFARISTVGREIVIGAQGDNADDVRLAVASLRNHLEALAAIHPEEPAP